VTLVNTSGTVQTSGGLNVTEGTVTLDGLDTGTVANYLALDGSNHVILASGLSGTGTTGTIPIWSGAASLGNSLVTDDGTTLSYAGTHINSAGDYEIGGSTILTAPANTNLSVGVAAGANESSVYNTFSGFQAGYDDAGNPLGTSANSFFGAFSGYSINDGVYNSFFGFQAGQHSEYGNRNTFIGSSSGMGDVNGNFNTTLGTQADVGSDNLTDATAIGANAVVNASYTIQLGDTEITSVVSKGSFNTTGGALQTNGVTRIDHSGNGTLAALTATSAVTFSGLDTGTAANYLALDGSNHVILASGGGSVSGTGTSGTIAMWSSSTVLTNSLLTDNGTTLSYASSTINTDSVYAISGNRVFTTVGGIDDVFAGFHAGVVNSGGYADAFFGFDAGRSNSSGDYNTFLGSSAGQDNDTGHDNTFTGSAAGQDNTVGYENTFNGRAAGNLNSRGTFNTFIGGESGTNNTTGSNNTTLGQSANVASGALVDATAIGSNAIVSASNTIQLGDSSLAVVNTYGAFEINNSPVIDNFGNGYFSSIHTDSLFSRASGDNISIDGGAGFTMDDSTVSHLRIQNLNVAVLDGNLGVRSGQFNVGGGKFEVQNDGSTSIDDQSSSTALTIVANGGSGIYISNGTSGTNDIAGNHWNVSQGGNALFSPQGGDGIYIYNLTPGTQDISGTNWSFSQSGTENIYPQGTDAININNTHPGTLDIWDYNWSVSQEGNAVFTPQSGDGIYINNSNADTYDISGVNWNVSQPGNATFASATLNEPSANDALVINGGNGGNDVTGTNYNWYVDETGLGGFNQVGSNTDYLIGNFPVLSTPGEYNLFVGHDAGQINSTGQQNTFVGQDAGGENTTGSYNSFVGTDAGENNTGSHNDFFGLEAGNNNSGNYNTIAGEQTGYYNTGDYNTILGYAAGYRNEGDNNVFSGTYAGSTNRAGSNNTALGYDADMGSSSYTDATAIGANAVVNASNTIQLGSSSVILVNTSGTLQTSGGLSVTAGTVTLRGLSSGTPTSYLALNASNQVVLASGGTISGTGTAGTIPIWTRTSAQGNSLLTDNGTTLTYSGTHINSATDYEIAGNTAFSTPGIGNLFAGISAGYSNSGYDNTFLGFSAGQSNAAGLYNTFIGQEAGYNTTGSSNTALGASAGNGNGHRDGDDNTFLGASSQIGVDGISNATAIGYQATVDSSNSIQLGNGNVTSVNTSGSIYWNDQFLVRSNGN
jgi:hypothetical protein